MSEKGKFSKWVGRMFKKPSDEGSTTRIILEELRNAKSFPQFLGVILHPRNLSLITVILVLLAIVFGVSGKISHFIKYLLLLLAIEGYKMYSYFTYWKEYRKLIKRQQDKYENLDESMIQTIMQEMQRLRKDCIELKIPFSKDKDLPVGGSKYGGCPDVPDGFEWPLDDAGRPLSLLLQFDCAELSKYDTESLLPKTGHLYFFYELSEMNWEGTENSVRVIYFDEDAGPLHRCDFPDSLEAGYRLKESPLHLEVSDSYPRYKDLVRIDPEMNYKFVNEQGIAMQRLGYLPATMQGSLLGYDDPAQDSILTDLQKDVLLLQFNSVETDDENELMFYDGGALYFVISREDLLARRFDKVRFELQSC